jgi:16S rRNA (cytidine1402-2'-O)-methyltransferase
MEPGTLYVVATPIGNLEDITVRAIDILKRVDLIACEDTRRSRILLRKWEIPTKLMSLHKFSESRKTRTILEFLEDGRNVALISDAGTPAVSDPGGRLVAAVHKGGFNVVPIPGPSSITAALSVSGFDGSEFAYLGFVPKKPKQRQELLYAVRDMDRTSVFFETPQRIVQTLQEAASILGSREMLLMRELTKIHEELIPGIAQSILDTLKSREVVKGEIIVVVEGRSRSMPDVDLTEAVSTLIEEGFSGKRLADEAHRRFGVKKGDAYARFLEISPNRD